MLGESYSLLSGIVILGKLIKCFVETYMSDFVFLSHCGGGQTDVFD